MSSKSTVKSGKQSLTTSTIHKATAPTPPTVVNEMQPNARCYQQVRTSIWNIRRNLSDDDHPRTWTSITSSTCRTCSRAYGNVCQSFCCLRENHTPSQPPHRVTPRTHPRIRDATQHTFVRAIATFCTTMPPQFLRCLYDDVWRHVVYDFFAFIHSALARRRRPGNVL